MKRLKDNSDVPEARLGILPKHILAQRKRQGYILLSHGGTGTPGCVNKKSRRKESLWWIREPVCIWSSERDLNSAELETHEDIEESDDGDDCQRRGANKRRSNGVYQTIGLICQSYAS